MNRCAFLVVLGTFLTIVGALLAFCYGHITSYVIQRYLPLAPDSESFKQWLDAPVPIYLDFYIYNWVNPEEFLEGGKPIIEQKGPYRYREKHEKVNVTWNDNGTITYERRKTWYYDSENSNGTLQDKVTTVNVVAASAAYVSRARNALMQMSLSTAIRVTNQKIWITRTVDELLFEGYSDPLITMAKSMPFFANTEIPTDRFGWFYNRNGTSFMDGVFNINTGAKDISQIGFLSNWNYRNKTDYFPGKCGDVHGSAGEFFAPGKKKGEPLEMYASDLCRSMKFDYAEEQEVHGVKGYQYVGGKSLLDNGTDDPSNLCYCAGECVPQGVLNVSSCRFGAPAFISYPHFLDADPYYINQVVGLNPDPKLHRFRITLEPNTGVPMDVVGRFQINILLQPSSYIALYNDVPRIFFPTMWFEQRATITPEMGSKLRATFKITEWMFYFFLAICFIGILIILFAVLPRFAQNWTIPKLGDKRKDDTVLYKRECIRPLMKGIPQTTNSTPKEPSDPPNITSTPA